MWVLALILLLLLMAIALIYVWSHTPYGRLDWRVALILKASSWKKIELFPEGKSIPEVRAFLYESTKIIKAKPLPLQAVTDLEIPGSTDAIKARAYYPDCNFPLPLVIYYHGGGWVIGSIETHDNFCRRLAAKTPAVVLSVDYRLAPEHPFPAAVEDAYTVFDWAAGNASSIKSFPNRIVVAGDSAGGTLATVVSKQALENGLAPAAQILIYPATDLTNFETDSHRNFQKGFYLTRDYMIKFRDLYLPDKQLWSDPRVSPLLHPVPPAMPPTLILTAEFDPLRDEGEAYAKALHDAGIPVTLIRYDGMIHGFVNMDRFIPAAKKAGDDCADFVKTLWL
jgi:acetyl esterase